MSKVNWVTWRTKLIGRGREEQTRRVGVPTRAGRTQVGLMVAWFLALVVVVVLFLMHAHFSRQRVPSHRVIFCVSPPSRFLMSLLHIPRCPSPRVLSSPTSPPCRLSASSTSMAKSCRNSPSASAPWSGSGRMANPAPNTSYEAKLSNFFSHMNNSAHADPLPRQPPRRPEPEQHYR